MLPNKDEKEHKLFSYPLDADPHTRFPYRWMLTLYLFKGIVFTIMLFSMLVVFKRTGYSNSEITAYIACALLLCTLRPLLSIFVYKEYYNRRWVLGTELLSTLSLLGIAYTLKSKLLINSTFMFYALFAISNIFHDIASDKYSLILTKQQNVSSLRIFKCFLYSFSLLLTLGIAVMIAGNLEVLTRMVRNSWSTSLYVLSGVLCLCMLWHVIILPRPINSKRERRIQLSDMFYACLNTNADLIRTPRSWPGILFLTFFLLPCALLSPISLLFMLDLGSSGGLALAPQEFGYVQGTIGVFAFIFGMVSSVWAINCYKLKTMLPYISMGMLIPSLVYIYLSFALPHDLTLICCCVFVQQLFYGFGVYGYLSYLAYYSEVKRFSTYSLCVSLAVAAIAVPLMISGKLQADLGYRRFFIFTAFCSIATLLVTGLAMFTNRKEAY